MRLYPALRIVSTGARIEPELVLAELDSFQPTAIEELANGLRAFFASTAARDAALAVFASRDDVSCVAEDVPDEHWAERSQAALTPATVGRLTIAPPWAVTDDLRAHAPGPVIVIQPSMGFGTGHHASTRLCLQLLQQLDLTGASVLDIGTGSGVLTIAAHVLGAARVVGIDVDPDALANARENLALNEITAGVSFVESGARAHATSAPQRYGVILANLTGALLIREADAMTELAGPVAVLITSGFQDHETEDVKGAFVARGWRATSEAGAETWKAVVFRRG